MRLILDGNEEAGSQAQGAPAPKATERPKKSWIRGISAVFVVGLFGWVIWTILRQADALDWSQIRQGMHWIGLAALVWMVSFAFRSWLWGEMMRRMGYPISGINGMRVFFASHLGRFLPGSVWSVVGAGVFARQLGVPASAAAVSMLMFLIMYYMFGSLTAVLALAQVLSSQHALLIALVGIASVATLVFTMSPWFPGLLRWLGRKAKRPLDGLEMPSRGTMAIVGLGLFAVWVAGGFALMLIGYAVVPSDVAQMSFLDGVSAYAAGLVTGFAAVFAPSGVGVREAVTLAVLAPTLGTGYAGIVSIASRVVITTIELAFSGWGIYPYLKQRRAEQRAEKEGVAKV